MKTYPKIPSVFVRDEKTHKFIDGQFRCPEFEYLQDNLWLWTEKVDGTNIRVIWDPKEKHLESPVSLPAPASPTSETSP